MQIENLNFNNGLFSFYKGKPIRIKTIREAQEQDWKTAMAHNIQPIPSEEYLDAEVFHNFYGVFLKVGYENRWYYIDPKDCDFISQFKA